MKIKLYYFDDCPSYEKALENLKEALRSEGLAQEVEMVPVASEADAHAKRLIGSPTIRIDGIDIEGPEAEKKGYGYGCRIYSENGRTSGWPSVEIIRDALQKTRKPGGGDSMGSKRPPLKEYWPTLSKAIPDFPPDQQRVAVTIYRELAKGKPASGEQLAAALGLSAEAVQRILSREPLRAFIYQDEQGRVIGFGGLAAAPMHHEFRVKGQKLWTWCAWDSLFIPMVLGEAAAVTSGDPETGEVVRLTVLPTGVERVEPKDVVVSFLFPDVDDFDRSAANVMGKFCHYVFFFASRESGERWAIRHEGTFLYSVEEAFELGQRLVMKQFGRELRRQSAA